MLNVILMALNAILPIVLLILLGYILKRLHFLTPEFLKIGNKLVFRVALPCLLFCNVYEIAGFSHIRFDVVLYALAAISLIFVLALAFVILFVKDPKRRGVVLQCSFRSNFAIIGLPLAASLGNIESESVAAVLSAFSIPFFNFLAVISLSVFVSRGESKRETFLSVLRGIVKNPMILSVAAGLFCLFIRAMQIETIGTLAFSLKSDLPFLYQALSSIKAMSTPLALIVLGGQFEFSEIESLKKEIAFGSCLRLVFAPLVGIGGGVLLASLGILDFGPEVYPAFVALFASPVAVSAAIMAKEMENDGQLAAQLTVWTSVFSALTVFLTVLILMGAGLINA